MKAIESKLRIIALLLVLSAIIFSCAKERPAEPNTPVITTDSELPVITLLQNLSSMYSIGVVVKFNFQVTDNHKLKSVQLIVTNTTIDSVYLDRTDLVSVAQHNMLDSVITNITTTMADFTVQINAIDSTGNQATLNKAFHVMN